MSCHSIGHGMNSIAKVVLDMFEAGEINKESAIKLIRACRRGVNWCDGNEYEAYEEVIERGYCGICFKQTDKLTNIFDNDLPSPDRYRIFDAYNKSAAHYYLCSECMEKVIEEYKKSKKIS